MNNILRKIYKNKILFYINIMPQISKKEKERKKALQLLKTLENKFNKRTYSALKRKIENYKKIDALQRELNKLKILRTSKDTNITKGRIDASIAKVNLDNAKKLQGLARNLNLRYVQKQTQVVARNVNNIWSNLTNMTGDVRITILDDGEIIKTFVLDLAGKKRDNYYGLYYELEYPNNIFDNYPDAQVLVTKDTKIRPERISQAFKHGTTNCLFLPIIKFFEEKQNTAKTEGTRLKYKSKVNVAKKLEEKYFESGVPEKDLQFIADKLQVGLKIHLPFDLNLVDITPNKKALTSFEYINTKLNHIDGFNHNEVTRKNKTEDLSLQQMKEKYNELIKNDEYFIFKRNNSGISKISTLYETYTTGDDFNRFIDDYVKEEGLLGCRICDIKNHNLSQYVRASNHSNQTKDFKELYDDDGELHEWGNYKHMDQIKAYKNVDKCNYYEGYLGKITDFRKTDKIVDTGLYTIKNIVLSEKIKKLNDKMLIYYEGGVYPSPELKFLKKQGCKFDIVEGCWGTKTYLRFDDPRWINKIDDGKNKKGVPWYSKFVGVMEMEVLTDNFYMNADKEYIQNLTSYLQEGTYKTWEDEVKFIMGKDSNMHLTHISSQIKSYCRINTLEQLINMEFDDILRVCCDGIFYYGDYECLNNFRLEEKQLQENLYDSGSFISNWRIEPTWETAKERDHYLLELHTGAGGTGKTTKLLKDKGFNRVCYIAPSWKLATQKSKEHNVSCNVFYNVVTTDPNVWGKIERSYNVLIVDEVTMLNNKYKELIFERYANLKIIMCGDIGHQLDGIEDKKLKIPYVKFNNEGFDFIKEHTHNYRVKDVELLTKLNYIRKLQDQGRRHWVKRYVLNNFKKINQINDYKIEDMILTRTNMEKDKYKERYKHLPKFYVTENTKNYKNGEIVLYEKPINCACEIRHAFTTHSIQGETAENNLYIHIDDMSDDKMIYTALSRARTMKQIYLVVESIEEELPLFP